MFELSKFELSGTKYKTLLNQVQGTWEFVRNNEKFELSGIRINGCVLYYKNSDHFCKQFDLSKQTLSQSRCRRLV